MRDVRQRPACLDDHQLFEFAGGRLDEAERSKLELHLDACPTCRHVLAAVARRERPRLELDPALLGG